MTDRAGVRFSKAARVAVAAGGALTATATVVVTLLTLRTDGAPQTQRPDPLLRQVDSLLAELPLANIAFNAPKTLRVDDTAVIQLLLSGGQSVDELQRQITELGETEGATIKVSDVMEARLTGLGFDIQPITPDRQIVGGEGVTQWKWEIDPTKTGRQRLHLSLSAVITYKGSQSPRTVRTFERTLSITNVPSSPSRGLRDFVSDNWQFLLSTLVIPLGLWLLHRRKKQPSQDVPKDAGSTT
jgi:hypothetical protein